MRQNNSKALHDASCVLYTDHTVCLLFDSGACGDRDAENSAETDQP